MLSKIGIGRDGKKFRDLAYPHLRLLNNIALRLARKAETAEDIVQETMYTAFKNFSQLRDEAKARAWLISILRSVYLRYAGKESRRNAFELRGGDDYLMTLEAAASYSSPEELFFKKADISRINSIMDRLPNKYRMPLVLSCMEGLSYSEISEALDIPIGTVMSSISRAKSFVKEEFLKLRLKEREPKVVRLDPLFKKRIK